MKKTFLSLVIITLFFGCSDAPKGNLILVKPMAENNFNFPYFLFIPDNVSHNENTYLIVEPNNSGFADDDLQKHIDKAKRTATKAFYIGNYVAQHFKYPLVVPVFPRPKSNWKIYTHALDRDVMLQKNNTLERIDLQLLAMVKDARTRLAKQNIQTDDKFLLTGFSASGTFANRFTALHPENVLAVAAGGLNGLLFLPMDSLKGETLNYPLGTNDFKKLTNSPFNKKAFVETPQFYFMGELDDNDAVPYDDAFDESERQQIFRLLAKEMLSQRWKECKNLYENEHVNAIIKTFKNTGHEHPDAIKEEIVTFFQDNIAAEKKQER